MLLRYLHSKKRAVPLAVAFPAQEAETPCRAVLVRLRPEALRLLQASFEHLADRDSWAIICPWTDHFFPRVPFVALSLFIRCQPDQLRRIEPPGTTGVKPGPRFRPQLIAITRQCLNFDSATSDWPELGVRQSRPEDTSCD